MRLREPFQGYKLSSGHYMFHCAYLFGSYIATEYVMGKPFSSAEEQNVFLQLNLAHIFTPILMIMANIANHYEFYVLERVFDTVSIFQYQGTIMLAQLHQSNSPTSGKFNGVNTWFIIEIISFYGYLLSAMIFILENILKSSCGILNKTHLKDRFKTDFIVYHREEIDWLAFITIPFSVNICLIIIEELIIFRDDDHQNPLRNIMLILLIGHFLHFCFMRNLFDEERRITKKHQWIWVFNIFQYGYVFYIYNFTDAAHVSDSRFARSWIPLDMLLMSLVAIYYFFKRRFEVKEETPIIQVDEQSVSLYKKWMKKTQFLRSRKAKV